MLRKSFIENGKMCNLHIALVLLGFCTGHFRLGREKVADFLGFMTRLQQNKNKKLLIQQIYSSNYNISTSQTIFFFYKSKNKSTISEHKWRMWKFTAIYTNNCINDCRMIIHKSSLIQNEKLCNFLIHFGFGFPTKISSCCQ